MPTPTKGPRLGAGPTHQRMILSNLSQQLFEHKRITTTVTKAKRLRPVAERLITFAKRGDLAARRRVMRQLTDKSVVHELFTSIAPAMEGRDGGYTRITKIGNRKGDNAPMAVIELVMEPVAKRETVAEAERATTKAAAEPAAPVDTPAGSTAEDVKKNEIPAEEQAPAIGSEEAAEVAEENQDAEFAGRVRRGPRGLHRQGQPQLHEVPRARFALVLRHDRRDLVRLPGQCRGSRLPARRRCRRPEDLRVIGTSE